ncbi:MAG: hypothetical protein KAR87_02365 [Candidatus Aenigmarchaeota archaeon]|nr:hypothetical protein [Candidatus Aenigmarchaeota archaeon]
MDGRKAQTQIVLGFVTGFILVLIALFIVVMLVDDSTATIFNIIDNLENIGICMKGSEYSSRMACIEALFSVAT